MAALTDDLLITNDESEVSDSNLWEAFKAVMGGHIISFESSKKGNLMVILWRLIRCFQYLRKRIDLPSYNLTTSDRLGTKNGPGISTHQWPTHVHTSFECLLCR